MTEWVRFYHDTPTDPKWRVIARKSGQRIGDVLAIWSIVLTNASANANERGRTLNLVHEDIAAALDLETEQVDAILAAMEGKVICEGKLSGWEKRNPIKEDGAAERAKRWRERKRTQANGANATDTDTDTETDVEKEGRKIARSADADEIAPAIEAYNLVAEEHDWPKVQSVTPKRRSALKARLREVGGIGGWRAAMAKASASSFLRGESGRGKGHEAWTPGFDFFTQQSSFTNLMEGKYDDRQGAASIRSAHDTFLAAAASI